MVDPINIVSQARLNSLQKGTDELPLCTPSSTTTRGRRPPRARRQKECTHHGDGQQTSGYALDSASCSTNSSFACATSRELRLSLRRFSHNSEADRQGVGERRLT